MKKIAIYLALLITVILCVVYFLVQPRAPTETEEDYIAVLESNTALAEEVFLPPTAGVSTTYKVYWPRLDEINPDIFGWLHIPDTPINFPLLQEQLLLEYFYLDHDYKRNAVFSGSIFTPAEPLGVDDAHLLLFGHRTKNRDVAFSSLFDLYGTVSTGRTHSSAYIVYPTETVELELWCAVTTTAEDPIYEIPYILGSVSYDKLLRQIEVNSLYSVRKTPSAKERIVVLSTCNGQVGGDERFYVVFVPVTGR